MIRAISHTASALDERASRRAAAAGRSRAWRALRSVLTGAGLALIVGCAMPSIPRNATVVAPNESVALKHKYDTSGVTASGAEPSVEVKQSSGAVGGRYILGPGDLLAVIIQRVPDAKFDVVVRPDGYISLPIVDEVEAAGLTPAQLDQRLTQLYEKRIVDPDVSVMVKSLREPMVYVLGKVARPGPVSFKDATSAAEAIARAGDLLPTADEGNVMVLRLDKDGKIHPLGVDQAVITNASHHQVAPYMALAATRLEPEDVLFVPERGAARFGTVVEQLTKPLSSASSGVAAVLNPLLIIKLLRALDDSNNVGVSAP